ncbi:MAG: hypothetical protein ABW219_07665 [Ilumatobacteraceae bacterium]
MNKSRQLTQKLLVSAAGATRLVGGAACGDDDDDSADTAAPAASDAPVTTEAVDHSTMDMGTDTTEATDSTDGGAAPVADVEEFCQAELAAEAAASQDPATAGPAFEALVAAAPADLKATVEAVIANAEDGPGSPEFDAAYGEMIGFVKENCGFADVTLTTSEYAFGGLPTELAAGPTVFTVQNIGEEFHEMLVFHVNDGVTETVEELVALPEEELGTKATFAAAAFGPPGGTTFTAADLEPGRYFAICFLPQGATPELMAQMSGPDSSLPPGAGAPHFMEGMVQEFTVA